MTFKVNGKEIELDHPAYLVEEYAETGHMSWCAVWDHPGKPCQSRTESTPTPDTSHHPGFMAAVQEIIDMHARKMADYGREGDPFSNVRASEDFGIPGWVGAIVRGNDKMRRLQKAAQGEVLVNESIEDSLLDLAVYCLIGLVIFREENQ